MKKPKYRKLYPRSLESQVEYALLDFAKTNRRTRDFYNLAIYPCNFGTKSYVRLADEHPSVENDRKKINKKNYKLFEHHNDEFSNH